MKGDIDTPISFSELTQYARTVYGLVRPQDILELHRIVRAIDRTFSKQAAEDRSERMKSQAKKGKKHVPFKDRIGS